MKKLKIMSIPLFGLFLITQVRSQITISGIISYGQSNPMSNALVEIIDEADTTNKFSDLTDETGAYSIEITSTGIEERTDVSPSKYLLLHNYPNPFNPSTVIQYHIPNASYVTIKIYDILGREIKTLLKRYQSAGHKEIIWDATDDEGMGVAAGLYICRIKTETHTITRKMTLLDGAPDAEKTTGLNQQHAEKTLHIQTAFQFTIRVTGQFIQKYKSNPIICTSDTTIDLDVTLKSSNTIGSDGGPVGSPDGLLSLTIPPGALSEDTQIDIDVLDETEYPQVLDTLDFLGEVYDLQPDGLELTVPAQIEVELTEEVKNQIVNDNEITLMSGLIINTDGTIEPIQKQSTNVNSANNEINVSGELIHFSDNVWTKDFYNSLEGESSGKISVELIVYPKVSTFNIPGLGIVTLKNMTYHGITTSKNSGNFGSEIVNWPFSDFGGIFLWEHSSFTFQIITCWTCISAGNTSISVSGGFGAGVDSIFYNVKENVSCFAIPPEPSNCGDDKLKHSMNFWYDYFGYEFCALVKDPHGEGTYTDMNGEEILQDDSNVNTYKQALNFQNISGDKWNEINETFPLGPDNFWIGASPFAKVNVTSEISTSDEHLVLFNIMHDTIPIADPVNYYQYGFVFDRDGDTTNNYQPSEYPYDFFYDTDYWIVASYNPSTGWSMNVTDARNGQFNTVSSDAKMIILGNTLMLFVPYSEFLADVVGYRMTAYRHPENPNGDVQPPVAEGLKWVYIGSD